MLLFEFFVPVTGRLGNAVNPEYIVMLTAFITTTAFILYTVTFVTIRTFHKKLN